MIVLTKLLCGSLAISTTNSDCWEKVPHLISHPFHDNAAYRQPITWSLSKWVDLNFALRLHAGALVRSLSHTRRAAQSILRWDSKDHVAPLGNHMTMSLTIEVVVSPGMLIGCVGHYLAQPCQLVRIACQCCLLQCRLVDLRHPLRDFLDAQSRAVRAQPTTTFWICPRLRL